MKTDGIYYFNRCRKCNTLITKLQIRAAFDHGDVVAFQQRVGEHGTAESRAHEDGLGFAHDRWPSALSQARRSGPGLVAPAATSWRTAYSQPRSLLLIFCSVRLLRICPESSSRR